MFKDGLIFVSRYDPVRLLLTFGAKVNTSDKYQQNTPLHWACITGNNVVAKILLDSGANLDAINSKVCIYMFYFKL